MMILKDTPRSVKGAKRKEQVSSPPTSRPHTATTVRSSTSTRIRANGSATSRTSESACAPPICKPEGEKRVYTSKETLVQLFDVWQPQLTKSYRPHVHYTPTDPRLLRSFMNFHVVPGKHPSPRLERFRAVERVVETVNHFHQQRGRESRMSHAQIKW